MKAIELTEENRDLAAAIQGLKIVDKPVPKPGPGEVLVKIEAAPCNPSDLLFLQGMYGVKKELPATPGWEGAGTVVANGGGALGWWLRGKRVACGGQSGRDGTWAEYYVAKAKSCIPLKEGVSFDQGATLIINPLTAIGMVERAAAFGAKAVVQTAACSQVGRMVHVAAKEKGLAVINIVRRQEQLEMLQKEGERWRLNSEEEDFTKQLKEMAERLKATVAFDAVGGDLTRKVLGALPDGSKALVYGALSERPCGGISPLSLIFQKKKVEGFWLTEWLETAGFWRSYRAIGFVQKLMKSGAFTTKVRRKASFDTWQEALLEYRQKMSDGKALLTPCRAPSQTVSLRQYNDRHGDLGSN